MQKTNFMKKIKKAAKKMIGIGLAAVVAVSSPTVQPVDTQVSAKTAKVVHSGSYGKTSWTINSDGLLVVKGTGDVASTVVDDEGFFYAPAWCQYAGEIKKARFEVKGLTCLRGLFYGCYKLQSVDFSKCDTSKVTDISWMFYCCSELKSLNCNFNTSKVKDMSYLFYGCESLKTLDISKFNTSNVQYMGTMFGECHQLTKVDLSKFDTSKVTNMSFMFGECHQLTKLDLSKFDTSKVKYMGAMLYGCDKLTKIKTPKKSGKKTGKLPSGYTWVSSKGKSYTKLPTNAKKSVTLKASKQLKKITLNATGKTLNEGKTVSLKVKSVTPGKASKAVTWKTSNKKVATVTSKGKVTAIKAGTAKITAVSKSNKKVKAVCTITVKI